MDEIQKQIAEAPLSELEKTQLISALHAISDEDTIAEISRLLKEKPWLIPVLSVNLAAKKKAFAAQDEARFSRILAEEINLLEMLAAEEHNTAA